MSFENTAKSWNRLKRTISEADEDTQYSMMFWAIGLVTMAAAIVTQFGWLGVQFCAGFVVWKTSFPTNN